jgi:hypothetical protein
VDREVRVLDYNAAASGMLGREKEFHFRRLCGEVLQCINADKTPGGCGHSDFCPECMLRKTVDEVAADGKVRRSRARLERRVGNGKETMTLLLSVSPVRQGTEERFLMLFEDAGELKRLEKILPICSFCKKIRNDRNYWESVEEYFRKHADLLFSHSICDTCMKEQYREIPP